MEKYKIYLVPIAALAMFVLGCTTDLLQPTENDGTPPGPVSEIQVENLSGSVKLSYTLPNDPDVFYAKAVYTTERNVVREVKASYYTNEMILTGFGKNKPYEVNVYAVDRGENASKPVTVMVNPEKAPYQNVSENLNIGPDFGGLFVDFENPTEDNLAIVVLANDSLGNFIPYNTYYTQKIEGRFSTRGFESEEADFGVYVRDRWGNISDTTIVTLTPFFEIKLNKGEISEYRLPNDQLQGYGGSVGALLNDNITESGGFYHSGEPSSMPSWFTLDLGGKFKLSRLAWWMRSDGMKWYFDLHNPREIEVWGSNNPAPDGSWESWDLLVEHEQIKPSGLPNGQLSNDDIAAAENGEDVIFPLDTPAYRYIRFKTVRNWSNGPYVNFNEISLWGQPID